ncbi:MAG: pilus assembly protein [Anaerolineales bacterium]|nr:pilus assembly protein [Anaerolineales bacterium]
MKKKSLLPISARGQSLVELAISLVILLYLLSGATEFAIVLFQYVQLRDAAQEGALYGSIHPADFAGIEARARASSNSPINLEDLAAAYPAKVQIYIDDNLVWEDGVDQGFNVTTPPIACEAHALKVIVSYDHHIFMPFMPQILNQTDIPLEAEVIDTILTPEC